MDENRYSKMLVLPIGRRAVVRKGRRGDLMSARYKESGALTQSCSRWR
jgi:hypothetical protein